MARFFNIAGPNNVQDHYTLPALARLPEVRNLIDDRLYFVVHAPRQVGKTTALLSLAKDLCAEGRYASVLVSMETGAAFPHDLGSAEYAILESWRQRCYARLPPELQPPPWPDTHPGSRIAAALRAWTESLSRPLVIFLDEIDALEGQVLLSILRQIRDGYADRPKHFPWSLALIGMRNVRDYKIASDGTDTAHSVSPFNIVAKVFSLRNFTLDEVIELYAQHTRETGQGFEHEALEYAYQLTQGQPWLVNALANEITREMVRDRHTTITKEHVEQAKEILIRRRDTHLDSLAERLREPRVRAIIEPMLSGDDSGDIPEDDIRFITDLGLMRLDQGGRLAVANPMYREIIVRQLSFGLQTRLQPMQPTWLKSDGKLDKEALLKSFLAFWRQHGEPLMKSAPYHEAAPHLVTMAFLHRVVNGGSIEREYSIGSGRMDLYVRYAGEGLGIELKVWRDGREDPEAEGLEQLDTYLGGLDVPDGWLIIFDRRSNPKKIADRLGAYEATLPSGRRVTVIRA